MSLGEGGGWSVQIWPPDGTVARQMARRELARPSQEQSFAGPCVPLAQGPEEATALPANSSLGLSGKLCSAASQMLPCTSLESASLPEGGALHSLPFSRRQSQAYMIRDSPQHTAYFFVYGLESPVGCSPWGR